MNILKKIAVGTMAQASILAAKKLWYGKRGERIRYDSHTLRYLPGTRPVQLKYLHSPNVTVSNDVKQIQFFLDNVHKGDFVLDIGGHVGQYAVLFGALVGKSGRVVTFEPDQVARKLLKKNLSLNALSSRVKVEEIALSDEGGTHSFFSLGGDSMSSLVRSGLGGNASSSCVAEQIVSTIPLDEYLIMNQLPFPQWIKLDTEGAEINILRGARQVLKSGANILCELHPYTWKDFGTTFDELLGIVNECGRSIRYLDESLKIEDGACYGATIIS